MNVPTAYTKSTKATMHTKANSVPVFFACLVSFVSFVTHLVGRAESV